MSYFGLEFFQKCTKNKPDLRTLSADDIFFDSTDATDLTQFLRFSGETTELNEALSESECEWHSDRAFKSECDILLLSDIQKHKSDSSYTQLLSAKYLCCCLSEVFILKCRQ